MAYMRIQSLGLVQRPSSWLALWLIAGASSMGSGKCLTVASALPPRPCHDGGMALQLWQPCSAC